MYVCTRTARNVWVAWVHEGQALGSISDFEHAP